jgi:hypothetical protein
MLFGSEAGGGDGEGRVRRLPGWLRIGARVAASRQYPADEIRRNDAALGSFVSVLARHTSTARSRTTWTYLWTCGHRLPAAGLGGAPVHPPRRDAYLRRSCPEHRAAHGAAGHRPGVRHQPRLGSDTVPPRGPGRGRARRMLGAWSANGRCKKAKRLLGERASRYAGYGTRGVKAAQEEPEEARV